MKNTKRKLLIVGLVSLMFSGMGFGQQVNLDQAWSTRLPTETATMQSNTQGQPNPVECVSTSTPCSGGH